MEGAVWSDRRNLHSTFVCGGIQVDLKVNFKGRLANAGKEYRPLFWRTIWQYLPTHKMPRAFNTINLLPGIHFVGKSVHVTKDTCSGVVSAARPGEAVDGTKRPSVGAFPVHYVRVQPYKARLRTGQRKSAEV